MHNKIAENVSLRNCGQCVVLSVTIALCVLFHKTVIFAQDAERVLWKNDCEILDLWSKSNGHIKITLDHDLFSVRDGKSSVKIICKRLPGMKDSGWDGWYHANINVPEVPVGPGDSLKLWYKVNRKEPYYPALYLHLIDSNGTRIGIQYQAGFKSGEGREIEIPLSNTPKISSINIINPGTDNKIGPKLVRIEFVFYYNWFRGFGNYIRWIDDLQIVRGESVGAESQSELSIELKHGVDIKESDPEWPVAFVSYRTDVHLDGDLSEWKNYAFGFAGIWGDTDKSVRECELRWPQPKSAFYHTDYSTFGEMVLLSKAKAGFTFRVSPNVTSQGSMWQLQLCGTVLNQDVIFNCFIVARDENGKEVRSWKGRVELGKQPDWWTINLNTRNMPAGNYRLEPRLEAGRVVLKGSPWELTLTGKSQTDWDKELKERIAVLGNESRKLAAQIKDLKAKSYETTYLRSSFTVLELFIKLLPYDINNHYYHRALKKIRELEDIAKTALTEADNPDRWCSTWRKVPPQMRPDDTPVTIKDGMFLHHGVPIYLIGVINQVDYANPAIAGLGFNSVSFNHSLRVVMKKGLDQPEWTDTYEGSGAKTKFLARDKIYTSEGLYWSTMIPTLHYVPEWVRKHPELSKGRGHFLPFAIELPITLKLVNAYYKTFLSQLGELKNMVSICLLNEPEYRAKSKEALGMYRTWLRGRYKTIEVLNRQWGTAYLSFDKIPITKNIISNGARYDWVIFNRKIMTDFVGNACKLAKTHDPLQRPVHVKCMSNCCSTEGELQGGIDREAIGGLTDLIGFDGGLTALHLDFISSLNPGKPLFHSEGTYKAPAQMWESMIHGLDALTLWLWDPPWSGWGSQPDYPLQQPAGLLAKGQTTLDLQRLAPEIQAIANAPHEVAILYSFASHFLDYDNYVKTLKQTHETLQWCQTPTGFVSEKQLRKGEVSGLKIIIVPDARFVLNTTVKVLKDFVGAGGQVILIGDKSLLKTPYIQTNNMIAFHKSQNVVILKKKSTKWTNAKKRLKWFDSQLTKDDINRPIRACNSQGQLIPGIELRSASFNGKELFYLCSSRADVNQIAVHLRAGETTLSGKNLLNNVEIKSPVLLKPKQPMLTAVRKM